MIEERLRVADKAENLYFSIFDFTTNRTHYPVKFRRLSDKLQEYALDLHSTLLDANAYRLDTNEHKIKRYELQTLAVTQCNKLLSVVKYSLKSGRISAATSELWVGLIHDVKNMTLAWRKN